MEIHTAGFAGWSARGFFGRLKEVGIERLVDVRLHNTSQLAAFAKRDDLQYFLEAIVGADYVEEPLLAPTDDILKPYKKGELAWDEFERRFHGLLTERGIEDRLDPALFTRPTVLLCSEHDPEHCHRRLVVEYLQQRWSDVDVVHLT